MKYFIMLAMMFALGICGIQAEAYLIGNIPCRNEDGNRTRTLSFRYDESTGDYYLCRLEYPYNYWFELNGSKLEKLRANLLMAKKWTAIAKERSSSVKKELPDSSLSVAAKKNNGNVWYNSRNSIKLRFFFCSKAAENEEKITLVMDGSSSYCREDALMDINFESVQFTDKEIDLFLAAISPESIEKARAEHLEAEKFAEFFN